MSTTLKWEPIIERGKPLCYATKLLMQKFNLRPIHDLKLERSDLDWLRGAVAATENEQVAIDINTLIEAIEKHGLVRLWEEC